jgi:hypothetical protein
MDDTRERVAAFLDEHWRGAKNCPVCESNKWAISDKAAELREFSQGGFIVGGPVYPLIVLTCGVCGHTLLFNAIKLGVVSAEPQAPAVPEEKPGPKRRKP